jgi:chromosome segregation ATPase
MADEKYLNYYIETLTGTMTDCIVRNVSLQATVKLKDDIIKEQADKIGEFAQANQELFDQVEGLKKKASESESVRITELSGQLDQKTKTLNETVVTNQALIKKITEDNQSQIKRMNDDNQATIKRLQDDLRQLSAMKIEYDKIKSQATHVDTFRNELIKSREEIKNLTTDYESRIADLTAQITELTTPTKKKRTVAKKVEPTEATVLELVTEPDVPQEPAGEVVVEDGGSF